MALATSRKLIWLTSCEKFKGTKCSFFTKEMHYLGHVISSEGDGPMKVKRETIQNLRRLETVRKM